MYSLNGYKILYVLIHTISTLVESILAQFKLIKQIYRRFSTKHDEIDYITKRLSKISKKPNHLTVILGVEDYSFKDLANLIIFCMLTEIPYITFYDFKENLKKQEEKLQKVVDSVKGPSDHIIWHSQAGSLYKNGFIGKKIHVKILTEEDGRSNIINLTKNLALNKEKDISIEKINYLLQKQYEFPDPEMCLVFGSRMHILNYPPWQLRLTEFFQINSISNITYSTFLESLEKFSKCEQRLGT